VSLSREMAKLVLMGWHRDADHILCGVFSISMLHGADTILGVYQQFVFRRTMRSESDTGSLSPNPATGNRSEKQAEKVAPRRTASDSREI
jgi:hypothetical protein